MRRGVAALATALLLAACAFAKAYQGPISDHFDGRLFHNAQPFDKGALDLLRFALTREPGEWRRDLDLPPGPKPLPWAGQGALRVTVVNHASVLIQFDGQNLLTDPIWSERASPLSWAGPRRYVPPGLRFEDLPRIDAVLISHNHYDHLDLPTLQRLRAAHDPLFIVGLGEAETLRAAGLVRIVELDWWQSHRLANGRKVWGTPSVHWTGRGLGDRNRSLWLSYLVETAGGPVYFAGDTGYGPQFRQVAERFGPMRLALLPIGAYKPRWLTAYQHLDPAEALRAAADLQAASALAIHFGTFELADDGQQEAPETLRRLRQDAGLPERAFDIPLFGSGYDFAPLSLASDV